MCPTTSPPPAKETQRDLNALTQTCWRLYHLLHNQLYRYNVLYHGGDALIWAATHDSLPTIQAIVRTAASMSIGGPKTRDVELVNMLVENSAEIDSSCLHTAIGQADIPILNYLTRRERIKASTWQELIMVHFVPSEVYFGCG